MKRKEKKRKEKKLNSLVAAQAHDETSIEDFIKSFCNPKLQTPQNNILRRNSELYKALLE